MVYRIKFYYSDGSSLVMDGVLYDSEEAAEAAVQKWLNIHSDYWEEGDPYIEDYEIVGIMAA